MKVTLSVSEMMEGAMVGAMRALGAKSRGDSHAYGAGAGNEWETNLEGALGEMAAAKAMNMFWSRGEKGGADVGDWQVRCTAHANGRLILHKRDLEKYGAETRFYLVRGRFGEYEVVGWIECGEGCDEMYWTDPGTGRPAYFVPEEKLNRV
jgi:hypothetical protein